MKKVLLIVLALGLFSCTKENEIDPVLERDYYEVNKNDTFDVSFDASLTSRWKWIKNQNDKVVDSINVNYIPLKVPAGVYGAGGNEIWKFKAKESGTFILTFQCISRWDPNATYGSKNITVKIK